MERVKINAIVNFAKPYHVAEGGSTNEGITINYLMTDSLKPYENQVNGSQGFKSTKSSISLSLAEKLIAVPGQYELSCELGVNSNGQPQLKPVDLEFLSYCELVYSDTVERLNDIVAASDIFNRQDEQAKPSDAPDKNEQSKAADSKKAAKETVKEKEADRK